MIKRLLGLCLLGMPAAFGYQLSGYAWRQPETRFHYDLVDLNGQRQSPSGIRWNDGFSEALQRWNRFSAFTFHGNEGEGGDPCAGDGRNVAGFRRDDCGFQFSSNTLAITYSQFRFGELDEADIVFNGNLNWDIYSGPLRGVDEFVRVSTHELGHALGLAHEDSSVPSIMTSLVNDLEYPQKDDLDGVASLYGSPDSLPPGCEAVILSLDREVTGEFAKGDCHRFLIVTSPWDSDDSYVDVYRFTLPETALVVVSMTSDQVDAYLELMTDDGRLIASDDDGGKGTNALLYTWLEPGTYRVVANTATLNAVTGAYRLEVKAGVTRLPGVRLLENRDLEIDAVDINGRSHRATLRFYHRPDDPGGWYWRLVRLSEDGDPDVAAATYVFSSQAVILNPVTAFGHRYDAVLERYINPSDPLGWYWRLGDVRPRR